MNENERDLDREVEDLANSGQKVQDNIDETKTDWESKKDDESVPGAVGGDDVGSDTFSRKEDDQDG